MARRPVGEGASRGRRGWARAVALVLAGVAAIAGMAGDEEGSKGFLGVILPQQEVNLSPLVEGRLQQLTVRIGDRVAENDLIAEIDERPIRRERDEAAGRLQEARAEEAEAATRLEMASETLARRRSLVAAGVVSQEQVQEAEREKDLAQSVLDKSRARVQQQQVSLEQIEARLAHTRLLAPFPGRVAGRFADPGALVGPEVPVIRLISDAGLWARFAVPADLSSALAPGGAVRVVVADVGAEMTGTIKGSTVDEASGMIFFEAVVHPPPDWKGPPLAGQAARIWPANSGSSRAPGSGS